MTIKEFQSLAKENRSEHEEQVEVVNYLRKNKILHFAIPNGGQRHKKTARDLKAEGVVPGVPDLMIAVPNRHYHALFIEMKRRPKTLKSSKKSYSGITVSDNQKVWLQYLNHNNYKAVVCYGADEAIDVIEEYMEDVV